jgi:hypothetical protein
MKIKLLSLLALACAAFAQPQIASYQNLTASDDGNIHLSVTMQYTTGSNCGGCSTSGSNCGGCSTSFHTYSDVATIDTPQGPYTCSFSDGQSAVYDMNYGCDVYVWADAGSTYYASDDEDVECSQMGQFFNFHVSLPIVTTGWSSYRVEDCVTTYVPVTVCTFIPDGDGCPDKCARTMTKLLIGGTASIHAPYSQCTNILVNDICTAQVCGGVYARGFCTGGVHQ